MGDQDVEVSKALELVDYWTPLVLRIVADAGVLEEFGHSARSPAEVAEATGVDPSTLARVLRALASRGVFEHVGDDAFQLTATGRLFLIDEPATLAGLANFKPYDVHAWAEASHSLRTGQPSFPEHYGIDFWSWLAADPSRTAHFNDAMRRRTSSLLEAALPMFDWPTHGTVVDLGGGNGVLMERLLRYRPQLRGIVFDLPEVAAEADQLMRRANLADRVECVAGDLFESVPDGHDVYVLASVLHDWNDADATKILTAVQRAMPATSRLALFESVLADGNQPDLGKLVDLHMLVLFGAGERTQAQWSELLHGAGFQLVRVLPTPGLSWIEARPASTTR